MPKFDATGVFGLYSNHVFDRESMDPCLNSTYSLPIHLFDSPNFNYFEKFTVWRFTFTVLTPRLTFSVIQVEIKILDVDDNLPTVEVISQVSIYRQMSPNVAFFFPKVFDMDNLMRELPETSVYYFCTDQPSQG